MNLFIEFGRSLTTNESIARVKIFFKLLNCLRNFSREFSIYNQSLEKNFKYKGGPMSMVSIHLEESTRLIISTSKIITFHRRRISKRVRIIIGGLNKMKCFVIIQFWYRNRDRFSHVIKSNLSTWLLSVDFSVWVIEVISVSATRLGSHSAQTKLKANNEKNQPRPKIHPALFIFT